MKRDLRGEKPEVTDQREPKPASDVPGDPVQPSHGTSTPSRGGGEFPDPDTAPSGLAPADGSPERGKGTFDEAYRQADDTQVGSGAIARDDEP